MEIGACLREGSAPPRDHHHHHRPPPVWVFHRRRQFCVFQHRSTVAGENQKPGSKSMFAPIFACRDLFLSGPIPIPVALGRIKSTCNAETWNFHPRFASRRYTQDRAGTVGQVGYSDVFQPFVRRRCWCYDCRAARFHHFQNRQKHPWSSAIDFDASYSIRRSRDEAPTIGAQDKQNSDVGERTEK